MKLIKRFEDVEGIKRFVDVEGIKRFVDVEGIKRFVDVEGIKRFEDVEGIKRFVDVEGIKRFVDVEGIKKFEDVVDSKRNMTAVSYLEYYLLIWYNAKLHLVVRLQFWCSGVTSSLLLLLDTLWPGVVVSVRLTYMGQIDMFENY